MTRPSSRKPDASTARSGARAGTHSGTGPGTRPDTRPRPTLVTTVAIAGLPCDVHDVRLKAHHGLCYDPRRAVDKGIRIDRSLTGRELIETVFHEVLHRALPDMSEEWVTDIAAVATEILHTPPFEERL